MEDFAVLLEKYCKCGYMVQAYVSCSAIGDATGFKRSASVTCPCCGTEIVI